MSAFQFSSEHAVSKARVLGLALLVALIVLAAWLAWGVIAPTQIAAQSSESLYFFQKGAPASVPNFVMPEAGCNWTGVGGQVFDKYGAPATGLVIKIYGTLEGAPIERYVLTGSALQFGPGGYEVMLANHLVSLASTLFLQVLDISGLERSPVIAFQVFPDCNRNLRVINLAEAERGLEIYFPLIRR